MLLLFETGCSTLISSSTLVTNSAVLFADNRTTQQYANEERLIREENLRLQRKLQMEVERREALCRHLSESESSLEMEEERHYNEITSHRHRTLSSPVPYNPSPNSSRPLSPGTP